MAADFAQILIRAKDDTKGAFDSASRNIRGLESAASKLSGVLSTLGVGAGLSVAGFAAFAKSGIDAADAMNDMSLRTGVAVKTLAEYKLAADQNGTSVEAMAKGIQKLTLSIGQAETGSKEQAAALDRLGISARDPKLAFEQLADAVAKSNDPTKTNADLQKVLGKNYAELLPLLQTGAQGLRDSAAASQTFAEQMAKLAPDADKFNDAMSHLKTEAAGAAGSLLTKLVPGLADTATEVTKLLDENHGVLALGRALAGIGKIPFDILIGDPFKPAETATQRIKELREELGQIERNKAGGNGILLQKIFGSPEELDRKILVIKNQIAALEKFGDKIYKPKSRPDAAPEAPPDRVPPRVKAAQPTKVQGPIDVFANRSFITSDKSTADFIRKQYEAVNDLQGAIAGDAQSELDKYAAKLNSLISDTPIEKTRILQDNVQLLDKAFFDGQISAELHDQAVHNLTVHMQQDFEKTRTFVDRLDDNLKSTFENAANGARNFHDVLNNVITAMGTFLAKEGGKFAGAYVTNALFDSPLKVASANGNVFMGAPALSAYSGTIVSRPTVFPFAKGIGLMGESGAEAILPLKRGRDGKLGVSMDGGGQSGLVVQVYNTIDARGADAGVETRIRRAVADAVDQSVAKVQSLNQRGHLRLT